MRTWQAILVIAIVAGLAWLDAQQGWGIAIYLGKALITLTEWMAFWR
ncbi:MAG: hypothetical protein AAF281_02960 [Pseudomonadota bacterium]